MLIAFSAAGLVLFLVGHLLGNLLVFLGADAFNSYAASLQSFPILLWCVRLGLAAIFLLHLFLGLQLRIENRRARPVGYTYKNTIQASLASRSMATTGLVMLAYIAYHLLHFTFGSVHAEHFGLKDSLGRQDVYSMVVLSFREPLIVLAYLTALFLTFVHLSHGIPSLFQSVGWNAPPYTKAIQRTGKTIALILFFGYISIPLAVYLGFLQLPVP